MLSLDSVAAYGGMLLSVAALVGLAARGDALQNMVAEAMASQYLCAAWGFCPLLMMLLYGCMLVCRVPAGFSPPIRANSAVVTYMSFASSVCSLVALFLPSRTAVQVVLLVGAGLLAAASVSSALFQPISLLAGFMIRAALNINLSFTLLLVSQLYASPMPFVAAVIGCIILEFYTLDCIGMACLTVFCILFWLDAKASNVERLRNVTFAVTCVCLGALVVLVCLSAAIYTARRRNKQKEVRFLQSHSVMNAFATVDDK